jgi:hypothetical protein
MVMRMCPYLDDPDSDCYCMNLNSQTVESVIHYCGGLFEECEFFRKREASTENLPRGVGVAAPQRDQGLT